jgi:hypothetical protein
MIPYLVTVRYRRPSGHWLRLHIPFLPAVLLLSPLLLLAAVGGLVGCVIFEINAAAALRSAGQLLWALPGTRFEYAEGQTAFLVSIR